MDGMSRHVANVYEQISGTPLRAALLGSDRPISIVTAGVDPEHETEWDRWMAYGALHARDFGRGFYRLVSKHFKWSE